MHYAVIIMELLFAHWAIKFEIGVLPLISIWRQNTANSWILTYHVYQATKIPIYLNKHPYNADDMLSRLIFRYFVQVLMLAQGAIKVDKCVLSLISIWRQKTSKYS